MLKICETSVTRDYCQTVASDYFVPIRDRVTKIVSLIDWFYCEYILFTGVEVLNSLNSLFVYY